MCDSCELDFAFKVNSIIMLVKTNPLEMLQVFLYRFITSLVISLDSNTYILAGRFIEEKLFE